jgi:outer membrane receptor for ferrienterochelin and colicins
LLLCAAAAIGQAPRASIRVEVRAESGPVEGAEVRWDGVPVRTGKDGVAVGEAGLGRVKVSVVKEGFHPAAVVLDVDAAREWVVAVELRERETVEEEVTVYATRNDVRLQDSPLRVEVLEREEIEEKMLMTPGDIVMMLNEMGGMRVQTTSPGLGAASVRVQGMRGRYTRFLSDGLPLFGQQGAGLGLLQIPPMDLGQVEVIKGTASALYGAGAMAGVVNLISRRVAERPVREFLINRSTLGATDVPVFLSARLNEQWSWSLLGGGHWQERRDIDGDGWADLAEYSRGVVRPRLFWDGGNGQTAMFTGGVVAEERSGGTMDGRVLGATGYEEALGTRRYDFGGNVQRTVGERHLVAARLTVSGQRHRHRFGELFETDRHQLVFGEVSVRGSTGRHTWVAGAAAERDAYRPRDVPGFAYTYSAPGVFVQDDFDVSSWLSVSASARADFHNRFGTFLSPRLSALLRWAGWTARLSAGQGFFAPTPLTEETEAAGLSLLEMPQPLIAERGRSASVDLTRTLGSFSFTGTMFGSTVRHPVYVDRGERYRVLNLPEPTRNAGVELLGTWRKAPFAATGSYTYVRSSELQLDGGRADIALTPRHSFGVVGMWEAEGTARVGVECYYTGRQRLEYNPYREVSRPYVVLGLMGERKVSGWARLFVNFENLTNVRQTRWDSLVRPGRGRDGRWTVDAWAPLDGRVINGGVRLVF